MRKMSKKPTYTKLPLEVQKEIKDKYLEGYSCLSLAKEYNLVPQSLAWYVKNHQWDEQRRLQRAELFQNFSDTKKAAFTGIYMDGTNLLKKAVSDAIRDYNENDDLSIRDRLELAEKMAKVISSLDKIQRLDDGSPTEIREDKPFSIKEVQAKLKKDPFYKEIENAEFKEIDETSPTTPDSSRS